jgi:YVTN family beta-propeller protein
MRRGIRLLEVLGVAALNLALLLPTTARAQVGGPKDMKPRAADEKARAAQAPAAKAPSVVSQEMEHEGVRVAFAVKSLADEAGKDAGLVAGANAEATFRVTDARTGQPVTGLRPNAWVSSRASAEPAGLAECRDKIRSFMGGLLSARAEVDLTGYLLLTINHDNTISVINPQVSFSKTQLESLITLPGPGADWALSKDKQFLYVTLPDQSAVAVVNTRTRKLVGAIDVGEKTRPVRIALQPDGRRVWVGLDGSPAVAVIDAETNKLLATLAAGAGWHQFAFTADGRFAYVTNSEADSVSAFDTESLAKVADIKVGKTPLPVAAGSASRLVYVAALNGATVSAIDPSKQQVVASIPVGRGVVAFEFEPKGRFGFAVNQKESTVSVLDSATNALVGSTSVTKGPDQVVFTNRYAYVRGTGSEKFTLVELTDFTKGKISAVDIQAGQSPASKLPAEIGVADMLAPTPGGNGAMIANTPDAMIYYYAEGMMAPMGAIRNYQRRPRALMLLDRGLAEVAPGVYAAPLTLNAAGRFDIPLLIDQPRVVKCFDLEVAASPDGVKSRPRVSVSVEAAFKGRRFEPGKTATLRFKITDAITRLPVEGLKDVQVLVFEPPGVWHQRSIAAEKGSGVYEVTQVFPEAALYHVMVGIASRGVTFADLPLTAVLVKSNPTESSTVNHVERNGNE